MRRLAGALALLFVVLAPAWACGGGGDAAPLPGIAVAEAKRDIVDDAPQVTSTVRVRFDRALDFAPRKVSLESLFEFSVPNAADPDEPPSRVFVLSAETDADDSRAVILHVGSLIPDGAELRVNASAFKKGATDIITGRVTGDLNPVQVILASQALALTREDVVARRQKGQPSAADRDAAAVRAELEAHLTRRGSPLIQRERALASYDAIPKELVPAPKLRAALAALTGTFAEPAIDNLLTSDNCTGSPVKQILFQPPPDNPDLFARVTNDREGRRTISVSPDLEASRIELLIPVMLHEAIHCDGQGSKLEEVVATAFDTYMYVLLLSVDPSLATDPSALARDYNVDAITMINSGRGVPESIGILPSPGVKLALPGTSSPHASFADLVLAAYAAVDVDRSPEEGLAAIYAARIAQATDTEPGSAFDLRYLDLLLGRAIDPGVLGRAIDALGMAPG